MRKTVIAGNWKLNKTIRESLELVTLLKRDVAESESVEVIVCPVYTALAEVAEVCEDSPIQVGAQDLYWEDQGAFTGEVSAPLLKDAGCRFVIIGHSERRQFFNETDATVNKKIRAALASGLTPIVCCGELLAERESGKTEAVLERQIRGAYADLSEEQTAATYVAYEPVWAIGTGKVATPDQAQEAHLFVRNLLSSLYSSKTSDSMPILYGGSVKAENVGELLTRPDVDGALVGGASLDAAGFSKIIRVSQEVRV